MHKVMEKLAHKELEKSSLYVPLTETLLNRIDLFLCNTDLTQNQKETLIKLFEDVHGDGFVEGMID